MSRRSTHHTPGAWLAEHWAPGVPAVDLRERVARLRAVVACREQTDDVRFLSVAIVPQDETVLCVVEAQDQRLVRAAWRRAGMSLDRLTPVLRDDPASHELEEQP